MIRKEFPDLNVRVIRYGLRLDTVRKNTRIYHKNDDLVFCYAGSLNHHKGVHVLIDAFNALRGERATLRIHGSGPDKKYIDHLRSLASQNPKIEFCGAYSGDQVYETLAAADAMVVPSVWHENTPMIVREALASHVPVICSEVGGVAEQVQHNQTGLLFKMGDMQALSGTLQRVVDDPEILNSLKGHIKSLSLPTLEQEAYAYDRIYRKLELASG
jgi:glycosyltransferase involved in cell wall biosynthesis